jgi:hypothetical protein
MNKNYRTTLGLIAIIIILAITSWPVSNQLVFAQGTASRTPATSYRREVIKTFSQNQFQREMGAIASQGWELILVNEGANYSHEIITYWRRTR